MTKERTKEFKERNKELKKEMRDFLVERLEETSGISIKKTGPNFGYVVIAKPDFQGKEKQVYFLLHSDKMPHKEYNLTVDRNNLQGIYTCNLFLNQENQFFDRLGKLAEFKQDRSLKKYSDEELKKIAKISGITKLCLNQIESANVRYPGILTFYEPANENFPKMIKGYSFEPVYLDYSHLSSEDLGFGFAQSGISKSLKSVQPAYRIYEGGLSSRVCNSEFRIATIMPPKRLK